MSPVDSLALATKKNLVDKSKLASEIHRISKEERTDMRLLNNAKQRFRNRYCKLDAISDNRGNEDIHGLVFTDDEVDVDKILCLHLLSVHATETLTPPPASQKSGGPFHRHQSPLERLIERSKKKYVEDKIIKLLPMHVLRVSQGKYHHNVIRDGRLAARMIINEKLNQLIKSVMSALENSNPNTLKELIEKTHNVNYLKDMICHPDMQDFINSLNGFNVISCCESFHLTPPFKYFPIELEVKTTSGYLESLVSQIRRNIFRLPINCCWDHGNNYFQIYYNPQESPRRTEDFDGKEREIFSERLDTESNRKSKYTFETSTTSESTAARSKSPVSSSTSSYEIKSSRTSETRELNANEDYENYQEPYKNPGTISKMDLDKVADFLHKKANCAIQKDLKNLQIICPPTDIMEKGENENLMGTSSRDSDVKKFSLKQTLCPACSEKWKIPLPTPKTSVIKRNVLNQKQENAAVPNDSAHKLSAVIDRELKFWNEYTTKSSKCAVENAIKFTPTKFYRSNIIEIIDMDELDLAKIRQLIREHETKKKLIQFLNH